MCVNACWEAQMYCMLKVMEDIASRFKVLDMVKREAMKHIHPVDWA